MQANVTFSQLYTNPSVMKFFFRQQSIDTLEDLISRSSMDDDGTLKRLEEATCCDGLDTIEEDFYELSVEELAEQFDIELIDEIGEELDPDDPDFQW